MATAVLDEVVGRSCLPEVSPELRPQRSQPSLLLPPGSKARWQSSPMFVDLPVGEMGSLQLVRGLGSPKPGGLEPVPNKPGQVQDRVEKPREADFRTSAELKRSASAAAVLQDQLVGKARLPDFCYGNSLLAPVRSEQGPERSSSKPTKREPSSNLVASMRGRTQGPGERSAATSGLFPSDSGMEAFSMHSLQGPQLVKGLGTSSAITLEQLASAVHLPEKTRPRPPHKASPSPPREPSPQITERRRSPSPAKLDLREDLMPSAAASPRTPKGGSFAGKAQLTLPSSGVSNDWARVRNCGVPLQIKRALSTQSMREWGRPGQGMLYVQPGPLVGMSSPPSMPSTPTSLTSALDEKTPRKARGMVRKVSRVVLQYPQAVAHGHPAEEVRRRLQEARAQTPEATEHQWKPPPKISRKQVSFVDKADDSLADFSKTGDVHVTSSQTLDNGTNTIALEKSIQKLECLFDLRRVGKEPVSPGSSPRGLQEEADGALLHQILKDLEDTADVLEELKGQLSVGQDLAADAGGARHATAVLSGRTLAVAKRKHELLLACEQRVAAFEAAHARREELLPLIAADTIKPPPEMAGLRKFIASYTHQGGNPADANKSSFAAFAVSFKLPGNHKVLKRLGALADEAGEWWAEACLSEASKGASHAPLRRLFDVAVNTGVEKDHPKLLRAIQIINDRLAERVLKEAYERLDKDTFLADRSTPDNPPAVGPAGAAADKIDAEVFEAVAEGVPKADSRLKEAEDIAKDLRQRDGERKRLANRQKRLAEQGKA
eukprot:TRINITY_DN42550_c0_g1_i1.p1 TRINITY_DN42550_c0_g1~~TRINITY_DN42550_c0_g1_i1.p1  ORF type:complete len:777 (+),score=139.46 TRINITY_DN42550_c0_g1_i1:95-2425(+)